MARPSSRVRGLRRRSSFGRRPTRGPFSKREIQAVSAPSAMSSSSMLERKPWTSPTTRIMRATPIITPSTARKLRSLWLRMVSIARCRFSRKSCFTMSVLRPQRFDGIQARGAHGGINAEEQAHGGGKQQGDANGEYRSGNGNGRDGAHKLRNPERQDDTRDAAGSGKQRRLREELKHDVAAARAERFAQADFAGPFGDAREHDVHDHDSADDEKHGSDPDGDAEGVASDAIPEAGDGSGLNDGEIVLIAVRNMAAREEDHARFVFRRRHPFGAARLNEHGDGVEFREPFLAVGPQGNHDEIVLRLPEHGALGLGHTDDLILRLAGSDFLPMAS